jgi:acylphosphatase
VNARVCVIVSGFVQGVFFRETTKRLAERSGVTGWVRNRDDGTVEAVFEGEEDDVKAMVEFCRHGPPHARVTNVEAESEKYVGEFDSFEIRL